jgi:hypothetical protein
MTHEVFRARALAALARHLPLERQRPVLEQAFAAATAITREVDRAQVLASVAPRLSSDLFGQLLRATTALSREDLRAGTLIAVAEHLPHELTEQALAAASSIGDDGLRVAAVGAVVAHTNSVPSDEVLASIPDERLRAWLATPDEHLTGLQMREMLVWMLAQLEGAPDDNKADALIGVAEELPFDLLEQVLRVASAIDSEDARARALVGLAPHLPDHLLTQGLAVARSLGDKGLRAWAMTEHAPYLALETQKQVLNEALTIATTVEDNVARATTLATVAERSTPDVQPTAVKLAQAAANAITDDYQRAVALGALAGHLPADERPGALREATTAANAVKDPDFRARALAGLAPRLTPSHRRELLEQALMAATTTTEYPGIAALADLAPQLPVDLFDRALAAVIAATGRRACKDALAGLAPYLPSELLPDALDAAGAMDGYDRATTLRALAPRLVVDPDLITQAFDAAMTISHQQAHAKALGYLAPYLTAELRCRGLTAATAIRDPGHRALALAELAPYLPADRQRPVLEQALDAAMEAIAGSLLDLDDYEPLLRLAPRLSPDLLRRALARASAIQIEVSRARALQALAYAFPAEDITQLATVVATTVTTASTAELEMLASTPIGLGGGNPFVGVWREMAPRLPPELLETALDAIHRAPKLMALSAIPAAVAIMDRSCKVIADRAQLAGMLRLNLESVSRSECVDMLAGAGAVIERCGGSAAVTDCIAAINDVYRWWP